MMTRTTVVQNGRDILYVPKHPNTTTPVVTPENDARHISAERGVTPPLLCVEGVTPTNEQLCDGLAPSSWVPRRRS